VRHVVTREASARIVPDTVPPDHRAAVVLLWLAGKQTSPSQNGALAIDAGGGVVEFNTALRPSRPRVALGGRVIAGVAAARDGGLWIVDATGALLRTNRRGDIVVERTTSFPFPAIASTRDGSLTWIVRSPERFDYGWDSAGALAVRIGDEASADHRVGTAILPPHVMLQDLANAGRVVAEQDRLFFAPFIRDEIVAIDASGDTAWVASRDLPQSTREPRFEVTGGKVVVDYHPVNLGIAAGPDGLLYVLSTPGFTTLRSRLDAFDPATGSLVRSADLDNALPTIAVDASGRVYLLDEARLLTGAAPGERQVFPEIALATSMGDSLTSAALRGRVVLVNLWASWCKPCREEMPALDTLRRALEGDAFAFLSINGDVSSKDARRFLRDVAIDMPFALAGPNLTDKFHAPGLPYSVLLDREGRIVQSWVGYSGPDQAGAIRAAAQMEIQRAAGHSHSHH
jgi:thiol-disulfide isomerase/thioredoxin